MQRVQQILEVTTFFCKGGVGIALTGQIAVGSTPTVVELQVSYDPWKSVGDSCHRTKLLLKWKVRQCSSCRHGKKAVLPAA